MTDKITKSQLKEMIREQVKQILNPSFAAMIMQDRDEFHDRMSDGEAYSHWPSEDEDPNVTSETFPTSEDAINWVDKRVKELNDSDESEHTAYYKGIIVKIDPSGKKTRIYNTR